MTADSNFSIIIEKLNKIYETKGIGSNKIALEDLTLSIPKGSIFGLLGPNGAGKSTLINILAGTVIKTSGFVSIMGHDIDRSSTIAKYEIGVVPQEVVFDSFFPISQTLEFTAGYYGIRPKYRKTEEVLKALGLWDKKDTLPRQLSGGMKRRFLIAKAMIHSPNVLILDEPTAGVDIELREQLWEYVKKLNNQGTTIIITTHYLLEAEELCDQIAFINNGKIIKQDTTHNLLHEIGSRHVDVEFEEALNQEKLNLLQKNSFEILEVNKIRFQLNSTDNPFNKTLSDIQSLGIGIKDLQVSRVDLETIFKKIIK